MAKHMHCVCRGDTTFGMEIDTDTVAWRKFKAHIKIVPTVSKYGVEKRVPCVPAIWLAAIMREAHWLVTEERDIVEFYIEGFMEDRYITVLYDEKIEGRKNEMEDRILDELKLKFEGFEEERGALVYLPLSELYPHPDNPRKELGDLTELAESIKTKGVMQNLTVVKGHYLTLEQYIAMSKAEGVTKEVAKNMYSRENAYVGDGYTVIIGHRRSAAAKAAGLDTVPCVIVEMSEREQVATMLLENMQRVDLTAFEQAQGFQMMIDFGDTVEGIAEKTGFSKKTVKHRLEMAKLNKKTLKEVSTRQITMEDFAKLEKIKSLKKRNEVLERIGTNNFQSAVEYAIKEEEIAEKMPLFVEKVKQLGATHMKEEDRWSSKYEQIASADVRSADPDKPLIPKKYQSTPLFYSVREVSGFIEIYRKRPKDTGEKRSRAEIEREKAIKENKRELESLSEMAKVLRGNFVKGLVMHSKNRDLILSGAVKALECGVYSYMYTLTSKQVLEFMGEETSNDYNVNQENLHKALREKPQFAIPAMIYLYFENDRNARYYQESYNGFPKHKKNVWLDGLYDWLVSLGYEMSDDETGLRDGTHPIFKEEE